MDESTTSTETCRSSSFKNEEGFLSPPSSGASHRRIRVLGNQSPTSSVGVLTSTSQETLPTAYSSLSTSATSAEVSKEDEHDVFGRHVANELRSLPGEANRRWARLMIQKVLYDSHSCHKISTNNV